MNIAKNKNQLVELTQAFKSASSHAESTKLAYLAKKRELDRIETDLIAARVQEDRAREALDQYKQVYVIEDSLDVARENEIADFRTRMDDAMKRVNNEKVLPAPTTLRSKRRKEKQMARRARRKNRIAKQT